MKNTRSTTVNVRAAVVTDVPRLTEMIHALAEFHGEAEHCHMTGPVLRRQLFRANATLNATVAEIDGRACGMLLWFRTYSTWDAATGLHIEDFYVDPATRGHGVGLALMTEIARLAVRRGYTRLEGQVISRNTLRTALVDHGGEQLDVWNTYRLDGDELHALAGNLPVPVGASAV